MDAARFDSLTKALVTIGSRRRSLSVALVTMAAVLLPDWPGSAERKRNKRQPTHKQGNDRSQQVNAVAKKKKKKRKKKPKPKPAPTPTPPPTSCPTGQTKCNGICVVLGTVDHCQRCGDRCSGNTCETVTCDRQTGCKKTPKQDGQSCGNNRVCLEGLCIDYAFPNTLKLPWCAGDREPRRLTQDWDGHHAIGIALDFGRRDNGQAVRGTPVLAPMDGAVQRDPIPGSTLGNHVLIDAGNGWQVILAHLDAFDAQLGNQVRTGDVVGTLGDSGIRGTEDCPDECPHIHIDLLIGVDNRRYKPDIDRLNRLYGHPREDFDCAESSGCRSNQTFSSAQRQCGSNPCDGVNCSGLPHVAEVTCEDGECIIVRCDSGFVDCDEDPDNGCETELGTAEACQSCNDRCQDKPCNIAICNPNLGCGYQPRSGDTCQVDGVNGTCVNGECITDPCHGVNCSGLSDACNDGLCQNGACLAEPKPDGTTCGPDGQQCVAGACHDAGSYVFVTKWGSQGSADGQFDRPHGVAVDREGYVYVAEYGFDGSTHCRIQKFTSDGTFVTKWGSEGSGNGQFQGGPSGIAVSQDGYVYVSDWLRIQKFTSDGTFVTKWGEQGSEAGQFNGAGPVAVDSDGYVYVGEDHPNHRIQKFTSDGAFVTKWGERGSGKGQFEQVIGLAVDSDGFVYASSNNLSIQKFTGDGVWVDRWDPFAGNPALGVTGKLAVDSDDSVYVIVGYDRIQKFTSDGDVVTEWNSQDSGDGPVPSVSYMEIAVDLSRRAYLTDASYCRVHVFAEIGNNGVPIAAERIGVEWRGTGKQEVAKLDERRDVGNLNFQDKSGDLHNRKKNFENRQHNERTGESRGDNHHRDTAARRARDRKARDIGHRRRKKTQAK